MTLEFQLSREELLRAAAAQQARMRNLVPRSRWHILLIVWIAIWVPLGFLWAYMRGEYGRTAAWIFAASVVYLLIAIGIQRVLTNRLLLRYVTQESIASMPQRITTTETGLIAETKGNRSELQWSAIKGVERAEEFLLIYVDRAQALAVPWRLPGSQLLADEIEREREREARASGAV